MKKLMTRCSQRLPFLGLLFLISVLFFIFLWRKEINEPRGRLQTLKRIPNIPSSLFGEVSAKWTDMEHLIIVPGHAIQWCTELKQTKLTDERCWLLLEYQRKQVPLFLEHIRIGAMAASNDIRSLLVFSGGKTRPGIGPRSESMSYYHIAEHEGLLLGDLLDRTITEEYARDSLENLVFSVCRFRQITGHYPKRITVVGFPFKERRFKELHLPALGIPDITFNYISVELPGVEQTQIMDDAYDAFKNDIFGCSALLRDKKKKRNPYKSTPPYILECPDLKPLQKC